MSATPSQVAHYTAMAEAVQNTNDLHVDTYTNVAGSVDDGQIPTRVIIWSQDKVVRIFGSTDDLEKLAHGILRTVDGMRNPAPRVRRPYEPTLMEGGPQ